MKSAMFKLSTTLTTLFIIILVLVEDLSVSNAQTHPSYLDAQRTTRRPPSRRPPIRSFKNLPFARIRNIWELKSTAQPIKQRGDEIPIVEDRDYGDSTDIHPLYKTAIRTTSTHGPIYTTYHENEARRPQQRVHPCEQSSCYPATGNLLIGRENRLSASSTCGMRGPERFCIVSHLEEKKCFLCDTRRETENDPMKNHRIGQIIYPMQPGTRQPTWWQSENGKQNVTVQLDLEAEFHFTHLIIIFATFRPAAMLIERSYDFGKTWHIYKYFAHNCAKSFPNAPTSGENITDVICDHRYSGVEPSKNGEVIFRVLPPNKKIENPYAPHIQNMLKMTNLRINFTRLHNLGDTLLDDREEIQEKYYYAIGNMIVRGSCSCYGHASRCLPLDGSSDTTPDMVHGRCECTHNTKGLNCEECEDFYNDLPWKPALGKQTNACKRCNCNNHANSCHFDQAVYEHSGRVSGGVCDNCQHNTVGQHCEECIQFFYRDPNEDIQSPYVCKACDCDPSGSLDDGICDSVSDPENGIEAGACHCKVNVKGRRCDTCKDGYWNLDEKNPEGCQNCTCHTLGTIFNSGCNMYTGECTCKRLVMGKDCNTCMPETYGLSDSQDGCSLCNCDPGGSLDNFCDINTGQCRCRPNMAGRTCNIPLQNYFIPSLHNVYEAEIPRITECLSHSYGNCSIVLQEMPLDRPPQWTGPGFERIPENTELQITVDGVPRTMTYDVVIRYLTQTRGDWEDARITLIRPEEYNPEGPCSNSHPAYEQQIPFTLPENNNKVIALHDICLEENKVYKFKIYFERHRSTEDNPAAQILIDSLSLVPHIEATPIFDASPPGENRRRDYIQLGCNQTYYDVNYDKNSHPECKDFFNTLSIYVFNGASSCECDPTGSISKMCEQFGGVCQCKPNVVGRTCNRCAPGTYGFGPEGCKACDCNSIGARDNDCDLITGQCNCHPNTYGRECDQCQPGFWNFPNCQMCHCNGHAQHCDPRTGECLSCQDFTTGYYCEKCVEGFYGNPQLGSEIGCRPCRCPDTVASGHTHSYGCELDRRTNDMVCYCKEGYGGSRCDICADNYFGNPEKPGGACEKCECNGNVDLRDAGNCDGKTGKCIKCLHDTKGDHCEYCRDGFFGDALKQDCRACNCDVLGTNQTIQFCNRGNGQCPCLANVEGLRCDRCIENHWKIASGIGCEHCACDPIGSESEQCNPYDGQCKCKPGFGGRQCNQCEANFWGDPNVQCHPCNCNVEGSAHYQCDRETGQCVCRAGIGGYKCDQCARGYLGDSPYCSPCGECFDNWDLILSNLEAETNEAIGRAKQIKTIGATGAYSTEFNAMENKIKTIQQLLDNTTVSMNDIEKLNDRIESLRQLYAKTHDNWKKVDNSSQELYSNINLAEVKLASLRNQSRLIKTLASTLKENKTELQEGIIDGALNLTRTALDRYSALGAVKADTDELNANAERQCKRTEILLQRTQDEFDELLKNNDDAIDEYRQQLNELNSGIPDLNNDICDKRGDPCDSLCGGAGCGSCGGVPCERGALTRAEKALSIVKDTEKNILDKKEVADNLIRSLSQAKANASEAYTTAKSSHDDAERYLNRTNEFIKAGSELVANLSDIMNNNTASPEEIKSIAEKTIQADLQLDPHEIDVLGKKISDVVASLENVESIIYNTRNDLERVNNLKKKANETKKHADEVLGIANDVVKALEEAEIAQDKAQDSIHKADNDIILAKDDLSKIDAETKDAAAPANETAVNVEQLAKKLNKLQKYSAKNDIDARSIDKQVNTVEESAADARNLAQELQENFRKANETLNTRAATSTQARERAQQLLKRASKLTVDTDEKLKELQGMANVYDSKVKQLTELQTVITELTNQMDTYVTIISSSAERYRTCQQ